jgi:hypothetical protein
MGCPPGAWRSLWRADPIERRLRPALLTAAYLGALQAPRGTTMESLMRARGSSLASLTIAQSEGTRLRLSSLPSHAPTPRTRAPGGARSRSSSNLRLPRPDPTCTRVAAERMPTDRGPRLGAIVSKGGENMRYVAGKNRRRLASWGVVGTIAAIPLAAAACSSGVTHFASYSASISSITPINSAQARTVVDIKNTSSTSGTPRCSVELYSPGRRYSGFHYLDTGEHVNPGDRITRTVVITVHSDGADQVTLSDSTVRCY